LYPFTDPVARWLAVSELRIGLLTIFLQHTSASLLIQENYDPDVTADLADYFERLAPERDPRYRHTLEGPDDMPAHLRTALTSSHLSIPIRDSRLLLGTWQGLYVFEHRRDPQVRHVVLHASGETNP
jgi:secondary thiamine-phosphate synthase enzyme